MSDFKNKDLDKSFQKESLVYDIKMQFGGNFCIILLWLYEVINDIAH